MSLTSHDYNPYACRSFNDENLPLLRNFGGIKNKLVTWFFKRAATNPSTVIISTVAEYLVEALVFLWFQDDTNGNPKFEGYLDAMYFTIKNRGFTGLFVSVVQNTINSPVADFFGTVANYYITVLSAELHGSS